MSDELPEGWASARLNDLLEPGGLFDGPFGSSLKSSDYTDAGVRVIRLENLANLRFVEDKETFVSEAKYKTLTKHTVVSGDIMVGSFVDGAVRVCVLPELRTKAIAKADCFTVRTRQDAAERRFIAFQLGTVAIRDAFVGDIHGATRPRITTKQLRDCELAVAPLPEQRRIVTQVEALLEQVKRAKGRLDRVPLILKRFRQAVLAAACSGELTNEWRERRTLSNVDLLLSEVARQRDEALKAGKKQRELGRAEALFEVPEEWRWTTLGHLAQIVGGVTKGQRRRPGERVRRVPYLRVANVQRGSLKLDEMKEIDATEAEIAELRLLPGDVLFTEGGDRDKLGRGWVWSGELSECIHQNHIFRARLYVSTIEARFVSWFGNVFGKAYFDDEASQTVNLASINITKLSALPVPIPPLEEQVEIVRQVDRLFALADTIEARVQAATARADKLPQAILSKAFSGELVPTEAELARAEGRTYETAEELLKRTAESRATASKPAAKKRTARRTA